MYPDSLQELIQVFKYLPGIGEKTAERFAFAILELDIEKTQLFSESIENVKKKIHRCKRCNNLAEEELCTICSSSNRNFKTLCIVEDVKSVFLFEKLGTYHGLYHVLNGLISPLEGINPEDIGISQLLDRLNKEKFEELIFAFRPSIEGETTALYIKQVLNGLNIRITKLASGVPIGADMEYIDALTLERALDDRKEVT